MKTTAIALGLAGLIISAPLLLTACGGSSSHSAGAAHSAIASATADPQVQHDLAQAKASIKLCITGTPLQQIHTVRVLLLESSAGKHAAEVTATRARVFDCLGVPADKRTAFKNDSLTAAEQQVPRVWSGKAGIEQYLLVTWPGVLAKYQQAASGASASAS